jgi:hypothetical protein
MRRRDKLSHARKIDIAVASAEGRRIASHGIRKIGTVRNDASYGITHTHFAIVHGSKFAS